MLASLPCRGARLKEVTKFHAAESGSTAKEEERRAQWSVRALLPPLATIFAPRTSDKGTPPSSGTTAPPAAATSRTCKRRRRSWCWSGGSGFGSCTKLSGGRGRWPWRPRDWRCTGSDGERPLLLRANWMRLSSMYALAIRYTSALRKHQHHPTPNNRHRDVTCSASAVHSVRWIPFQSARWQATLQ